MDDRYHYGVLGLKMNASQSDISKAWKNMALIYHPVTSFFTINLVKDKTKIDKAVASEKFI